MTSRIYYSTSSHGATFNAEETNLTLGGREWNLCNRALELQGVFEFPINAGRFAVASGSANEIDGHRVDE